MSRIKYWFFHRFHPKHKYNKVKLPLPPGYYDPETRIVYTVFEEFSKWFKFNNHLLEEYEKFKEIYDWWQSIRLTDESFEMFEGFPLDKEEKQRQENARSNFMYLCENVGHFWH